MNEGSPEEGDLFSKKRRLHIRPGSPRRIPVTTTGENASVVLYTEEATVCAMRFEKPVGMVELSCEPLGDGRVRLHVIPSVEHGEMRQQWGTAEGAWMVYSNRPRQEFESLAFRTILSPGQTLLVTASGSQGIGCGSSLLVPGATNVPIMLVRLAQTQMDDLFNPTPVRRPLATTTDSAVW